MSDTHFVVRFQIAHACRRTGGQGGRQRGREDEAAGIRADRVDDHRVGSDISTHHAECLSQGAFADVDLIHDPIAFGNTTAALAVHADGVHLIKVGHGTEALGQGHDRGDVGDIAIHGIDTLERDQFRCIDRRSGQQRFQVRQVIVAKYVLFAPASADSRDHRGMVLRVREDDQTRQNIVERRECRFVRNIT